MKKSQNGFVLVSVLLITTISTVYAFNEIKGNQLQERIGGNQQKEMNARMLAEKGVFDTFSYIQGQNIGNVSHATITHAINDGANNDPGKIRVYSASVDTDGKFSFYSQGTHNGAQAFMNAIVEVEKEHIWYPDATGVVGCDGVNLESGIINSYNSTTEPGQYSEATSGNKGNVATINATGDVTLGSGIVNGSVTSNGKVETTNSTTINGDVTAQKNIDLSQGVNITGNLHSGKDSNIDGGKIVGNVNAVGNVTHGSGVGEVQGDVKYGKNFGLLNSDNEIVQSTNTNMGTLTGGYRTAPGKVKGECDYLDITPKLTTIFDAVTPSITTLTNQDTGSAGDHALSFTESGAKVFANSDDKTGTLATKLPIEMDLRDLKLPKESKVYVLSELKLTNSKIQISGDVVLIVDGETSIFGGQSGFEFASGAASKSSLTIITKDKVTIGSDTAVFTNSFVNSDGEPPLRIFSGYESTGTLENSTNNGGAEASKNVDNAVLFNGGSTSYAKIYAPKGYVTTTGSGGLLGAVRAKEVDVRSDDSSVGDKAGIHYDEALGASNHQLIHGSDQAKYGAVYYSYQ